MQIEYVSLDRCVKCGSWELTETSFNEIHGHFYRCDGCGHSGWGGRVKNQVKNEKRPPYPSPKELGIDHCQWCLRPQNMLFYSEVLETHHLDNDAKNATKGNMIVLCTKCHKQNHHDRLYLYHHALEGKNGE